MAQVAARYAHWVKEPGSYGKEEIARLLDDGSRHYWFQFHQGRDLTADGAHQIMVKGEGNYLYDIEGNRYLDAMAGLYLMNLGHGRTEIIEAIHEQLLALPYANSGSYVSVPGIELATMLAKRAPGSLDKTFFCNGGGEAVEIGLKMARQIQHLRGFPKKTKIIARRKAYHGSTWATMSLSTPGHYHGVFEPHLPVVRYTEQPGAFRNPWGLSQHDAEECARRAVKDLERLIEFEGADTVAAFIATPNGAHDELPHPSYWPAVREICDKHDILLIADEVICAFGRLGTWFGMERWGVEADIMTLAKGLTAGYLPCGAVMTRRAWADLFEADGVEFDHGVTYGGHPAVMAAGIATLELMERENAVQNSDEVGKYLYEQLMERIHDRFETVGFVGGGMGLMATVNMVKSRETMEAFGGDYTKTLTEKMRQRGVATRAGDEIWICLPLTAGKQDVDLLIGALADAIEEQEKEYPPVH
jgi:adenosylmethionine-8-amino-7-oxononanoate aminotransferase